MSELLFIHFQNHKLGGVYSVINSLIENSVNKKIENRVVFTVNTLQNNNEFKSPDLKEIHSEVFNYSPAWNFYFTCKKLHELIPDNKSVLIAHDWLELGMISNLGLPNPVIFFLHGDYEYYYDLAVLHEKGIDMFITVASVMKSNLIERLPHRKNDIEYLRFPVNDSIETTDEIRKSNIIFIGRLTNDKGFNLLPLIAKLLNEKKIDATWHIVGEGSVKSEDWEENTDVKYYGQLPKEEVRRLLPKMNLLILPSLAEGMPVSVIEAMKAGVIPLVNNIAGGIQELVVNGLTGYKFNNNNIEDYASKIELLLSDNSLSDKIRKNAIDLAKKYFDPVANTQKIEDEIINKVANVNRNKKAVRIYGSRLDQKWIPNSVVTFIRKNKIVKGSSTVLENDS